MKNVLIGLLTAVLVLSATGCDTAVHQPPLPTNATTTTATVTTTTTTTTAATVKATVVSKTSRTTSAVITTACTDSTRRSTDVVTTTETERVTRPSSTREAVTTTTEATTKTTARETTAEIFATTTATREVSVTSTETVTTTTKKTTTSDGTTETETTTEYTTTVPTTTTSVEETEDAFEDEYEDEYEYEEETTPQRIQINSLDKLNFYAVKEAIAEHFWGGSGATNLSYATPLANGTRVPNVRRMNEAGDSLSPDATFTITMYSYFTVVLGDQNGFLAQKLGGTGLAEVVITRNNFNNMITFKMGDRYYSCFQTSETERAMSFSTHKYVSGFRLVENYEQENYEFTVYFESDKVIGINCGRFVGNTTAKYAVDDIRYVDNFCFVIHKTEQFTAAQLEALFASNHSFSDDGIRLQDGTILFGEATVADNDVEFRRSSGATAIASHQVLKVRAMYHPTYRFCIWLELTEPPNMLCKETLQLYINGQRERTLVVQKDWAAAYLTGLGNKSRMSDVFYKLTSASNKRRIGKILDLGDFVEQMSKRLLLQHYTLVTEESTTEESAEDRQQNYTFTLKKPQSIEQKVSNYDVTIDGITLTFPLTVSELLAKGFSVTQKEFNDSALQGRAVFRSPRGNEFEGYCMDFYGSSTTFLNSYVTQMNVYCYDSSFRYQEGIRSTRPNFEMLEGIHKDSTLDDIISRLGAPSKMELCTTDHRDESRKDVQIRLSYDMKTPSLPNGRLVFTVRPVLNGDVPSDFLTDVSLALQ